jgi:hypothetical protein
LRKVAATRAALRGYSKSEMDAAFGWIGGAMAAHYARAANRERLAIQGRYVVSEAIKKPLMLQTGRTFPHLFLSS